MSAPTPPFAAASVDLADIQGIVRFGYKRHTQAAFLLLQVKDASAARAWLADVAVSDATTIEPPPQTALHVALTSDGMHALGVDADVVEAFAAEFVTGMSGDANRARRLGDLGANASSHWQWGAGARVPHVLVMIYAVPDRLAELQRTIESQCAVGFDRLACLASSDMDGVEPFGFADGISQPAIDWQRQRVARDQERAEYSNLSCLGEYLLGYPNEYGGYTDRPLLDPLPGAAALPRAEDAPDRADLGRNGSYLVLRQLGQDVGGFWQFVDREAGGNAGRREAIASAMVGRRPNGESMVGVVDEAIEGGETPPHLNAFTYLGDPHGTRCPLGAHVRRVNPRNSDLPPGPSGIVSWVKRTLGFDAVALDQDLIASTRFHRLLRRGREYGRAVPLAQALLEAPAPQDDPGLHFICLGANIARQFEFVQNAWVAGIHFDGLPGEGDPLLGTRLPASDGAPTDGFSMAQPDGTDQRVTQLPRFVTVLGGAYFFLPGIRALRFLATTR